MSPRAVVKVRDEAQPGALWKSRTENPRIIDSLDYKLYPFNLFSMLL